MEFTISDQLFFETLKFEIRGLSIAYAAHKKKVSDTREKELIKKIEELFENHGEKENPENTKKMNDLENELQILREGKAKSTIMRAKANWIENGEKCSKYFCSLEAKNYTEKLMFKLIGENDKVFTKTEDIIGEQERYYKNLYRKKSHLSRRNNHIFMDNDNPFFTKISNEDRMLCEKDFTMAECANYLKHLKNGKSPGLDGFTVEFFKFFS